MFMVLGRVRYIVMWQQMVCRTGCRRVKEGVGDLEGTCRGLKMRGARSTIDCSSPDSYYGGGGTGLELAGVYLLE